MKPYYEQDGITIYLGDCLDVMPQLVNDSSDIVVTSPPYNMGLVPGGNGRGMYRPGANNKAGRFRNGYGTHGDAMDQDAYDEWQREAIVEMWRICKLALFYNHRPRVEHGMLRMPLQWYFGGHQYAIWPRQLIVWDRGTGIDVNLRHYCSAYEFIYLFAKPEFTLVSHAASGTGNVWRMGMEFRETGHPAPFPLALPMRALETTGATSVLDPFMGSGTTLVAAQQLKRKAIGIEIEERYCEIAARRLGRDALFAESVP